MKGRCRLAIACLSALPVLPGVGGAATHPAPTTAPASALADSPTSAAAQGAQPDGVVFNSQAGTYSVHRVPERSREEVMKSVDGWKHQVLADDSTADFSAEDGILSMECSACGLTRPSAIDLATVDLEGVVAYEAGTWHIGIRSKDGTQDFFGVLRGELGPQPHDPARVDDDQRIALMALADLYDLAYLTQNPGAAEGSAPSAAGQSSVPEQGAAPAKGAVAQSTGPAKESSMAAAAAKGDKSPPSTAAAAAAPAQASKSTVTPLATLAANGDVEGIQARRNKINSREVANALETAYGVRARAQMLEGQVDSALQTLGAGRQSFGKSAALRDREAHYVVIGDLYDRLRLAVKLDVSQIRDYLRQIQTLEPADATSIEHMLVHTFADRIADQRAAGRKNIVDDLITAGKDLFPTSADQLSQGRAGALTQAGVEIDTDTPPTAERSSSPSAR